MQEYAKERISFQWKYDNICKHIQDYASIFITIWENMIKYASIFKNMQEFQIKIWEICKIFTLMGRWDDWSNPRLCLKKSRQK